MYYLTFVLRDPENNKIRSVGVKYKDTPFIEKDNERIVKNGTANPELKDWIKTLKKRKKAPILEILYSGQDSVLPYFLKQQILLAHEREDIDLIGIKISDKKYTKKLRSNDQIRLEIIDQNGVVYPGVLCAAEQLFLSPSNISKVLHGKLEHTCGYVFKFKN